jgi:hypothetical protein
LAPQQADRLAERPAAASIPTDPFDELAEVARSHVGFEPGERLLECVGPSCERRWCRERLHEGALILIAKGVVCSLSRRVGESSERAIGGLIMGEQL